MIEQSGLIVGYFFKIPIPLLHPDDPPLSIYIPFALLFFLPMYICLSVDSLGLPYSYPYKDSFLHVSLSLWTL